MAFFCLLVVSVLMCSLRDGSNIVRCYPPQTSKWTTQDFTPLFGDATLPAKESSPTSAKKPTETVKPSVIKEQAHWQDISPNRRNKLVKAAHRSHEASLTNIHAWDGFVGALQRHFDFMASGELSMSTTGCFHGSSAITDRNLRDTVNKTTEKSSVAKAANDDKTSGSPTSTPSLTPDLHTSDGRDICRDNTPKTSTANPVPDLVPSSGPNMNEQKSFSVPDPLSISSTNVDHFFVDKTVMKMDEHNDKWTTNDYPLTFFQQDQIYGDMGDPYSCDALLLYDQALTQEERSAWAGVDGMAVYAAIEGTN